MTSKNKDKDKITVPVVLTQGVLAKMIEESDIKLQAEVSPEALDRILKRKVDQYIDSYIKGWRWQPRIEPVIEAVCNNKLNELLSEPHFVKLLQNKISDIIVNRFTESVKASVKKGVI